MGDEKKIFPQTLRLAKANRRVGFVSGNPNRLGCLQLGSLPCGPLAGRGWPSNPFGGRITR